MIAFGPIPSRRLGKSLGINNISGKKVCSYSCIYCQVGKTTNYKSDPESFYDSNVIFNEVRKHLDKINKNDWPDYLTFVSNGEPTLDINLDKTIELLKTLKIPVAVITNASLLHNKEVRNRLISADWVSVKIDTDEEDIWNNINRPYSGSDFAKHIEGLITFTNEYKGILCSETMLVKEINDNKNTLQKTAELVAKINPDTAYISIPTRPPAYSSVKAPYEEKINEAFQIFSENDIKTELLLGFEGTNTGFTGNAFEDIVNICTVHPIREDTMKEILKKDNADYDVVDSLIYDRTIKKISYNSKTFYIRNFNI